MIKHTDDCSIFPNDVFEKIAQIVKYKENKKLYKTCSSDDQVKVAIKEIKLQGYNYEYEKLGDNFNVYSILPDVIDLHTAENSGNFKKLAWGRYSFQKQNSINGFENYNFDDGSIWKTITGKDGKEYLVKEISDNDENEIIRTADLKKTSNVCNIDDNNFEIIMQILYHNSSTPNSDFMSDLLSNQTVKQELYKMLGEKVYNIIIEKLQNQNLNDQNKISEDIELINKNINEKKIMDENTLEALIYNYIQESMFDSSYSIEKY